MKQEEIRDKLASVFGPDVIKEISEFRGQVAITVVPEKLLDVGLYLKEEPALLFDVLSFVGAVDRFPATPRFEMVYQLNSLKRNHRIRIKTLVGESAGKQAAVDSVVALWPTANWHERETSEMFGITFKGHPDPRKLLMPDHWTVHPLRKDFPVMGSEQETPDLPPRQ